MQIYRETLCAFPTSLIPCSENSSCLSSLELGSVHLSSLRLLFCLGFPSLPQKEFAPRKKIGVIVELILCVFLLSRIVLLCFLFFSAWKQLPHTFLSSFIPVFGGKANLLIDLSRMEVEVLYSTFIFWSSLSRVSFKSQHDLSWHLLLWASPYLLWLCLG